MAPLVPNARSEEIPTTFPERSSSMASRRDSVALIRRYLLISVILVTIPLLLVWRFLEDAQVAIVATVRAVPLTALTALARDTNGDKPEDGQLDSAGVQLDAGMLSLAGGVVVFAVVVTLIIYRSLPSGV
jgi:hypothetical protein